MSGNNLCCTLAIGSLHVELALFLTADFAVYGEPLLVVTDQGQRFRAFTNAIVVEHYPAKFSFHDKKVALREALKRAKTAVFIDADTVIHFWADRRQLATAFAYDFSPGLHGSRLFPEDVWPHPHLESFAAQRGYRFSRSSVSYWEGLFALSDHSRLEEFFKIWDDFHLEANKTNSAGAGEGMCFGIAAEAAGLQRNYCVEMVESGLPYLLWPTRLKRSRRIWYHMKFVVREALAGNLNLNMHAWSLGHRKRRT